MKRSLISAAALLVLFACNNRAENDEPAGTDSTVVTPDPGKTPRPSGSDTLFTAFGNEPFWALYVIRDQKLLFHPADGPDVEVPYVAPTQPNPQVQRYVSSGDSATIELNIVRANCSDGMSDLVHNYETKVSVNAVTYYGCGRE